MHVLYFHQHFSTPQGSAGTRSYEMAQALLREGHSVTMVCGSYAQGKTGLSEPFRRGRRRGMVNGIDVIEFNLNYGNEMGVMRRLGVFAKFAFGSIGLAMREPADVIFATTTPLTAGIPGIVARWLRRKPFVFEVRDLWPELPRAMGMRNPLLLGMMSALEWASYRSADRLIGLSPGIVEGIARRGVAQERIAMAPNGCDLDLFAQPGRVWRPQGARDDQLLAVFSGTHGPANGLDAVLDAAAVLKALGRDDIRIALIGQGREKPSLMRRARDEGLDNVLFLDPAPKTELAGLLAGADIGLQILRNLPAFFFGTSPNKFFDYIAAGLPVLNNYPGWLAGLIGQHECGFAVPPDDPRAFADALIAASEDRQELERKGQRARALAETKFSRERIGKDWVEWVTGAGKPRDDALRADSMKRLLDIAGAGAGLVLLAPLFVLVAILMRINLGSPVLFRQTRPGQYGRPFEMTKFRTMRDASDAQGNPLPDSERLTRLGRFLRSSSLDELPELWNVLRGDMSLVGPRPLLMEYLPLYSPQQARRHEVRPGITGWAQVNGRNAISWDQKFALDVWYVDNRSFGLDVRILWMTILKVFRREGISASGEATMPKFTGSRK